MAWALARYPATLCEHALLITSYRVYLADDAVQSLIIPRAGLGSRRRAAMQLLGMLMGMVVVAVLLLAVTVYSQSMWPVGVTECALAVFAVLFFPSMAVRLILDRPRGQARGARPPGARAELTSLAAWPRGRGHGMALFDAVLTDVMLALNPGESVILEAGSARLAELYAAWGFVGTADTRWMRLEKPGKPEHASVQARPDAGQCQPVNVASQV